MMKLKYLVLMTLMITGLCSCMTPPGLGGKTKLHVSFDDVVINESFDADGILQPGGQDTNFSIDISAPAGVDIASIASMVYELDTDGAYRIGVNGDMKADTTVQAEVLSEIQKMNTEQLKLLLPVILGLKAIP